MKVPHVIAEIVSEFAGFQHTPDFKASRSTGNFEEDPESESHGSSSGPSDPSHHHSEHHGHSLYFGKHLKKHHSPDHHHDADTHSNHSGNSGKHAKHGLSVHFANLFHFGHHQDHEDHPSKPSSGASTPARKNSTSSQTAHQKHSIHITVGADEVPTICATPPNEPNHHHFVKNQNSSPNISRVASYSSLREKLHKIKRTTSSDSETDFPEKKCSVTSYRVVGMSDH